MTAVDPRTIAVNAARWLLTDGWDGCRLDDGNPLIRGAGYTLRRCEWVDWHGVRVFRRQEITVDLDGIAYHDSHPGLENLEEGYRTVVPTHGQRPTWAHMARAVDHLCADGVLPHELSTGYQLASLHWAKQVTEAREAAAKAQEAKALADQNVRDLAEQLATLDANIAAQMHADAATVRDLRRQLDKVTTGAGRGVKAVAA